MVGTDLSTNTLNIAGNGSVTASGMTFVGQHWPYWRIPRERSISAPAAERSPRKRSVHRQPTDGHGCDQRPGLDQDDALVFDSPASLVQTLKLTQSGQNITVNLDLGTPPARTAFWVPAGTATVRSAFRMASP